MSPYVAMLPHIEQGPLFEQIAAATNWAAFGPYSFQSGYGPWQVTIPGLLCPSDPGASQTGGTGRVNYCHSRGDTISDNVNAQNPRGVFGKWSNIGFRHVVDGTSTTIAFRTIQSHRADAFRQGVAKRDTISGALFR